MCVWRVYRESRHAFETSDLMTHTGTHSSRSHSGAYHYTKISFVQFIFVNCNEISLFLEKFLVNRTSSVTFLFLTLRKEGTLRRRERVLCFSLYFIHISALCLRFSSLIFSTLSIVAKIYHCIRS